MYTKENIVQENTNTRMMSAMPNEKKQFFYLKFYCIHFFLPKMFLLPKYFWNIFSTVVYITSVWLYIFFLFLCLEQ